MLLQPYKSATQQTMKSDSVAGDKITPQQRRILFTAEEKHEAIF
jgi:hypothetical protein